MSRFIFFTKTLWTEPPRLRHQLARLLAGGGHEVIFFQKPRYPWQKRSTPMELENGISVLQHQEIFHHKLRVLPFFYRVNAYWVKKSILKSLEQPRFNEDDVVVNFNYDYFFLRDIFPKNHLFTIINDNFQSRALFGYAKPLLGVLRLTCASSDVVLTVSEPLQKQLSQYCEPQLFRPWADCAYRKPLSKSKRDTLLFWGYMNSKIDFLFVMNLAENLEKANSRIRMLFVGPIENSDHLVEMLRSKPNIEVQPATSLDNLPLDRVFAGFIPYRISDPEIDAITLPNKALQLLARGLPLLIRGMPDFLAAPFVFRAASELCLQDISQVQERFDDLQSSIQEFVSGNGAQARLEQFLSLVH